MNLFRNRLALVGAVILVVLAIIALAAPWLAPHDPLRVNLPQALLGPSAAHPLGTDPLGRDVLSRLIFGDRKSVV